MQVSSELFKIATKNIKCFVVQKMINKMAVGPARSADYSPDGEMVAVGLKNGGFVIITLATFRVWGQRRDRGSMINVIR